MPANFFGGGSGGGGSAGDPRGIVRALSSLPDPATRQPGDWANLDGSRYDLVDETVDRNIYRGVVQNLAGSFTGDDNFSWDDGINIRFYVSKTALGSSPPATIDIELDVPARGINSATSVSRAQADDRTDEYAYHRTPGEPGLVGGVARVGDNFSVSCYTDIRNSVPLAIHGEDRWENSKRSVLDLVDDSDIPGTLPRASGRQDRTPSVDAVTRAIDGVATSGSPAWGPNDEYSDTLGNVGAGDFKRIGNREIELEPEDGDDKSTVTAALKAARGLRLFGGTSMAAVYPCAVTSSGTGIAHPHIGSGILSAAINSYSTPVPALGRRRIHTSDVTGLSEGDVVYFVGVRKGTGVLNESFRFRVASVSAANNTFDLYSDEALSNSGSQASWHKVGVFQDDPDPDLTITAAAPSLGGGGTPPSVTFTVQGTAPALGTILSFDNVTGIQATGYFTVASRTANTFTCWGVDDGSPGVGLGGAHATRLTIHTSRDLPAAADFPLVLRVSYPDTMVTARAASASAASLFLPQTAPVVRSPQQVSLWAKGAAQPADPAGWSFRDSGWIEPTLTPWYSSLADVPARQSGEHLWEAVAFASPGSPSWTLGGWSVYVADGPTVQWSVNNVDWHNAQAQDDVWIRHRRSDGSFGPGIWVGPINVTDTWTEILNHWCYESAHAGNWANALNAPIRLADVQEMLFQHTMIDLHNSHNVWVQWASCRPHDIVPADYGETGSLQGTHDHLCTLRFRKNYAPILALGDFNLTSISDTVQKEDEFGIVFKFRRGASDPAGTASYWDKHWTVYRQQFGRLRIYIR